MAKTYSIDTNYDMKANNCYSFDTRQKDNESAPTYSEVLKIFRKAFSLVDMNSILKKM